MSNQPTYNLPQHPSPLPLFIVTGANGVGKSSIVPDLARIMGQDWHVFDLDLLADGYNYDVNWVQFKNNWLRLAAYLAQSGRPTILCGTMTPENVAECEARDLFPAIHYLALTCHPDVLEVRLRARGSFFASDDFIATHKWLNNSLQQQVESVDTTDVPSQRVAQQVGEWAKRHVAHGYAPYLPSDS